MQAKIIFFIPDANPSKEEQIEAAQIPAQVCFRNVRYIGDEDKAEECDGVHTLMNDVPKPYRHLPRAPQAVEAKHRAHMERLAKVGDEPAPGSKFEKSEKNRIRKQAAERSPPGAPNAPQTQQDGQQGEPNTGSATDPPASVGSPQGAQMAGSWGGKPTQ